MAKPADDEQVTALRHLRECRRTWREERGAQTLSGGASAGGAPTGTSALQSMTKAGVRHVAARSAPQRTFGLTVSLLRETGDFPGRAIGKSDRRSGKIQLCPWIKALPTRGARYPCPMLGRARLVEIRSFHDGPPAVGCKRSSSRIHFAGRRASDGRSNVQTKRRVHSLPLRRRTSGVSLRCVLVPVAPGIGNLINGLFNCHRGRVSAREIAARFVRSLGGVTQFIFCADC